MIVTLTDYTYDPVNRIGAQAAICYGAETSVEKNIKRATHCKEKGHLMTLRFAYASFNIQGISRVCSHQLVRVAHAGILQESQRYVEQTGLEYVLPPSVSNLSHDLIEEWYFALAKCSAVYKQAIREKMKKEDARYILPQACTTQLNMTGNFHMWRDLLNNRTKGAAQWEVREVAIAINNELTIRSLGAFCLS
jgi:thymidylate synthase (FAD)